MIRGNAWLSSSWRDTLRLRSTIHSLIARLLAHMGLYSRHDATDLVQRINQPAMRERLNLLFADMRGFTQLCQSQEIIQTQKIENDLLTMFADQVLVFGDIVNKFCAAITRTDENA